MNEYQNRIQVTNIISKPYEIFCIFEGTDRIIELPPSEPSLLETIAVKADN